MESLGELIKRTLKEKGIKETFVAEKMSLSKQVVNQIDRRKHFDIDFLIKLKEVTGLDFTEHLTSKPYKSKSESVQIIENIDSQSTNAKLLMNFGIPPESYDNIYLFMKEMGELAAKYGIKVL